MKNRKKVVITIILMTVILFFLGYLVLLNTTSLHFIDIESDEDNNCYTNSYINTFPRLARINDKLYYNYYNDFLKYGTYEISNTKTKRIYWEGPSISSRTLDLDNIWNNKILFNQIRDGKIEYFNISTGKYQPLFDVKSLNEFIPESYFIANGECYYFTSDSSLYKSTKDGIKKILSNEIINFDSYSTPQFYKEYIYFIATKHNVKNEVIEYLCKYDPKSKKIINKMLYYQGDELSGGLKRFSCDIVANDKVYGLASNVYNELPLDYNTYVYAADIKKQDSKVIFKSDGRTKLNCYRDKAYICVENGDDKGIYYINTVNNELTKIYNADNVEEIIDLYIVDSKWIYFIGEDNNSLYRITQDGKTLEKVFG